MLIKDHDRGDLSDRKAAFKASADTFSSKTKMLQHR